MLVTIIDSDIVFGEAVCLQVRGTGHGRREGVAQRESELCEYLEILCRGAIPGFVSWGIRGWGGIPTSYAWASGVLLTRGRGNSGEPICLRFTCESAPQKIQVIFTVPRLVGYHLEGEVWEG